MTDQEYLYWCIAYPCAEKRAEESAFCTEHKAAHAKSKYPAILRQAMEDRMPAGALDGAGTA